MKIFICISIFFLSTSAYAMTLGEYKQHSFAPATIPYLNGIVDGIVAYNDDLQARGLTPLFCLGKDRLDGSYAAKTLAGVLSTAAGNWHAGKPINGILLHKIINVYPCPAASR